MIENFAEHGNNYELYMIYVEVYIFMYIYRTISNMFIHSNKHKLFLNMYCPAQSNI